MTKKILVLGANGQLGKEVVRIFSDTSKYDVCAPNEKDADIVSLEKIQKIAEDFSTDVIVNCAAFTNVDRCETETTLAKDVNGFGAFNCAEVALRTGAFLIHVSTDYVYDGKTKFNKVSHIRDLDHERPLNYYGISKQYGELLISERLKDIDPYSFVIFRTSGLYGRFGNNFLSKMQKAVYDSLNTSNTFKLIVDQWYCPTSALQLARQIKIWADLSKEDKEHVLNREGNILNANNVGYTSPYAFFSKYCVLADYFGFLSHIAPIRFSDYFCGGRNTAARPESVILENEIAIKYGTDLNAFTTIEEALEEYVRTKD